MCARDSPGVGGCRASHRSDETARGPTVASLCAPGPTVLPGLDQREASQSLTLGAELKSAPEIKINNVLMQRVMGKSP